MISVELDAREVEWEFAQGRKIRGFAYNGQVPGPLIEAEVGDELEIRLRNSLPQATTIHWHGIRVPAEMDGTEAVQPPVEPGETFEYRFVVPDAGTCWYHSHTNETEQLERGLYGGLVVRGPDEPKFDRERVLLLDDLKLDPDGEVAPFGDEHEHHAGREGDVRLVNGTLEPELEMPAGTIERWRIVDAANTRFVRLAIGGRPLKSSGRTEGCCPVPGPRTRSCSRRESDSTWQSARSKRTSCWRSRRFRTTADAGSLPASGSRAYESAQQPPSSAEIPATLRQIEPLAEPGSEPTRTISLKALMHEGHHQRADPVRVGELQVWELVNETGQDHPFHIHGFFFQVLQENGQAPTDLAWKDTVNVPRKSQTRIAWLPDDRPGEWMYHCHILEHHAMGMMAHFAVVS